MSDFREQLHRAAQPHGEAVGQDLTADALVASSIEGISRGRRRRASLQAGAGVLGAVIIGVGAWLVPPLTGDADREPAAPGEPVHAGPYRYEVGADPEAYPIEDPAVVLRGEGEVMCGDEVSLTPGVHVHDADAFGREIFLEAELQTLGDVIDGDPPATPQPLFSDWPDGPTDGWDPATPQWEIAAGGSLQSYRGYTMLVDGDTVVGVAEGVSGGGQDGGFSQFGGGTQIAPEGQCQEAQTREELTEQWSQEPGDPMSSLFVAQFWGGDVRDRTLLATIVVDPNEPSNSDSSPSSRFDDQIDVTVEPAELREPDGDQYQAFVVERPEPGCAPLASVREAGHPAAGATQYTIELPVLGDLRGDLWAGSAVLRSFGGDTPWFVDAVDAWLVADSVTAGIEDPHLEWHPGLELTLRTGGSDPLRGDDCAYVEPVPDLDGAVFLVIDGVEGDVVPDAEGFQTWVYLGQAE